MRTTHVMRVPQTNGGKTWSKNIVRGVPPEAAMPIMTNSTIKERLPPVSPCIWHIEHLNNCQILISWRRYSGPMSMGMNLCQFPPMLMAVTNGLSASEGENTGCSPGLRPADLPSMVYIRNPFALCTDAPWRGMQRNHQDKKYKPGESGVLLTDLFNMSIKEESLPQDWTQAFITPVYKKRNTHNASNYLPVSITSVTCKLLEHSICKQILTHMEEHNLMSCLQHGFRKSTHARRNYSSPWISSSFRTTGRHRWMFDTAPHKRLLGKLLHNRIKGPIQQWIRAFLTERMMWVTVAGASSPPPECFPESPKALWWDYSSSWYS